MRRGTRSAVRAAARMAAWETGRAALPFTLLLLLLLLAEGGGGVRGTASRVCRASARAVRACVKRASSAAEAARRARRRAVLRWWAATGARGGVSEVALGCRNGL